MEDREKDLKERFADLVRYASSCYDVTFGIKIYKRLDTNFIL